MTKNKTTETEASVSDYLKTIKNANRRNDCIAIVELFRCLLIVYPSNYDKEFMDAWD